MVGACDPYPTGPTPSFLFYFCLHVEFLIMFVDVGVYQESRWFQEIFPQLC